MPGPRFCRLAVRLGAYQGALAARIESEREHDSGTAAPVSTAGYEAPAASRPPAMTSASGSQAVEAIPAALAISDIGDMFSFGTAHA